MDPHASDRNRAQQPAYAANANGSNGHEELPEWARPPAADADRETAGSGAGR